MRFPLLTQILILSVLVAIVAGSLGGMATLIQERLALDQQINQRSLASSELTARLVESDLAAFRQQSLLLSGEPALVAAATSGDPGAATPALEAWLAGEPTAGDATLYDDAGVGQATGLLDKSHLNQVDADDSAAVQQVATTGQGTYLAPMIEPGTAHLVLPWAAPVLGPDGSVRAILVTGQTVSSVLSTVQTAGAAGTVTSLVDLSTDMAISADTPDVLTPLTPDSPTIAALQGGQSGVVRGIYPDGTTVQLAYAPVSGTVWGVVVQAPAESVLAFLNYATSSSLFLTLLAILCGASVGAALAAWLLHPVVRLTATANAMASGHLSRRVNIERHDEIGDLGRAFDGMADKIERMLADSTLEASEKQAILEQMGDGLLVCDTHGVVVLVNPAMCQMVSTPESAILGRKLTDLPWDVLGPDETPLAADQRPLQHAIRGEAHTSELCLLPWEDPTPCWVAAQAVPLRSPDGGVRGAMCISRNVTDRKRAEQQATALARSERLRSLGQMASGIAHDLSHSLAIISGYGDLASAALGQPRPDLPAIREALTQMRHAATDGGNIVKRLLAYSRDGSTDSLVRVDLAVLLRDVAGFTSPRWEVAPRREGRPITLDVHLRAAAIVLASPQALREALTNLIFNAVDALPQGGQIDLTLDTHAGRVILEVRDTGVGMSPDVQAHIFEPFYTTKGERGTGLGLSQVFGAVQISGGEIAVDSVYGVGTAFVLTFPLASEMAAERLR